MMKARFINGWVVWGVAGWLLYLITPVMAGEINQYDRESQGLGNEVIRGLEDRLRGESGTVLEQPPLGTCSSGCTGQTLTEEDWKAIKGREAERKARLKRLQDEIDRLERRKFELYYERKFKEGPKVLGK